MSFIKKLGEHILAAVAGMFVGAVFVGILVLGTFAIMWK